MMMIVKKPATFISGAECIIPFINQLVAQKSISETDPEVVRAAVMNSIRGRKEKGS